jgi:hypothetical protein
MADDVTESPALPTFPPDAEVCGNCKLWRAHSVDHRGWVGPCRVQANRGLFPPSAPICDAFAPKGVATAMPRVEVTRSKPGVVKNVGPMLVRKNSAGTPAMAPVQLNAPPRPNPRGGELVDLGGELNMTRDELMQIFLEASGHAEVPLAQKWEGGHIQLVPGKTDLQAKELPIDTFFHKVVMVRDRLRVLEQKINGHPKLSDAEKVEMQQYITRAYGSLTSFNVLFRDRDDQFVGAAKGDE